MLQNTKRDEGRKEGKTGGKKKEGRKGKRKGRNEMKGWEVEEMNDGNKKVKRLTKIKR